MEETTKSWSDAKAFCEEQDAVLLHIGDMWVTCLSEGDIRMLIIAKLQILDFMYLDDT